jgi:hypothetical protein
VEDEIVVTTMGIRLCKRYSFATGNWRHSEEHYLPLPIQPYHITDYTSISDGSNFYFFGERNDVMSSENWCYNFSEKKWKNLQALSLPLRESAICLAQLPSKFSKRHNKSPHHNFYLTAGFCSIHDLKERITKLNI